VPSVGCDVMSSFAMNVFRYALPPAAADNDVVFGARIFVFFMTKIAASIVLPADHAVSRINSLTSRSSSVV